jgi:hypothetical protein
MQLSCAKIVVNWFIVIAGTAQGYHTLTLGLYADFLIRKIDKRGRTLGQFFAEEIAAPFGKLCVSRRAGSLCIPLFSLLSLSAFQFILWLFKSLF